MIQITYILRFFKENENLLLYMALILVVVFWNRSCTSEPKAITKTVSTPYIHGMFQPQTKIEHKQIDLDSLTKLVRDTMKTEIVIQKELVNYASQENKLLLKQYEALQDEFERYKLFHEFIKPKQFQHTFEDERLLVNVQGLVRGEVSSLTIPSYTIKPIDVEVEIKKPRKKRFGIGPYFGYDLIQQESSLGISIQYSLLSF